MPFALAAACVALAAAAACVVLRLHAAAALYDVPQVPFGQGSTDKARDKVAASFPSVEVHMRCFPFMIDPGTQPGGEEYRAYNERRWGGDGWTRSMKASGRKEGAPYENWKWWPNTTHASRLLMFAERFGLGGAQHPRSCDNE